MAKGQHVGITLTIKHMSGVMYSSCNRAIIFYGICNFILIYEV